MKRKLFTLGFLTLALVALTLGSAWAKTVRIGLMCPLTGSWASEGQDMKQSVELLAEETHTAGGIGGAPVELVVEDDGGDPSSAPTAPP
jgi:branched-chain amino acid transport system substrate-binding protein